MVTSFQIDLNELTSTVLRETGNIIVCPDAWVQGDGAYDAKGRDVSPTDPEAVCWSVAAALQKAAAGIFFDSVAEIEADLESAKTEEWWQERELKLSEAEKKVKQASNRPSLATTIDEEHVPPDELDDCSPSDFFWGEPDFDTYDQMYEAKRNVEQLKAELDEAKEITYEAQMEIDEAYKRSRHIAENELVETALAAVEGYLGGAFL